MDFSCFTRLQDEPVNKRLWHTSSDCVDIDMCCALPVVYRGGDTQILVLAFQKPGSDGETRRGVEKIQALKLCN